MELKVAAPKANNREVTVEVNIPAELNAQVELYGEDVVADAVVRSMRIAAQGFLRPMIEANASDEEIVTAASTWMPGAKRDSFTTLIASAKSMSPEKRAALLAALGQ